MSSLALLLSSIEDYPISPLQELDVEPTPLLAADASILAHALSSLKGQYFAPPDLQEQPETPTTSPKYRDGPDPNSEVFRNTTAFVASAFGITPKTKKEKMEENRKREENPRVERETSLAFGFSSQFTLTRPTWVPDEATLTCLNCSKPFTLLVRRHHCRAWFVFIVCKFFHESGAVICNSCSQQRIDLPFLSYGAQQRVCDSCFASLSYVQVNYFCFDTFYVAWR